MNEIIEYKAFCRKYLLVADRAESLQVYCALALARAEIAEIDRIKAEVLKWI